MIYIYFYLFFYKVCNFTSFTLIRTHIDNSRNVEVLILTKFRIRILKGLLSLRVNPSLSIQNKREAYQAVAE